MEYKWNYSIGRRQKNNEITGEKKNKEKQKRKNHLDIFDKLLGKFFS
jgi:hypothetical protein